jgi:hypothetical protein
MFLAFYSPQTQCTWNQQAALFPDGSFFAEYDKPVFVVKNQTEISLLMDAVSFGVFNASFGFFYIT